MAIKKKAGRAYWQDLTTEENVAEIHRQLFMGVTPRGLAKKVQAMDPPLFADRTVRAVERWFDDYRRKRVEPEKTKALLEAAKFSGRGALRRRLDVIAELEEVAIVQRDRFNKWVASEHESPVPLSAVTDITKEYRSTLESVAKLYLETGLMHRVPKKIEAALTTAMGGRPVFEFTAEEVEQFDRTRLIEGMTAETIDVTPIADDA
jgi:hypothetical protein